MKKGVSGIEFIIAVTFFLIAFWYVFVETSEMLTEEPIQEDFRQPIIQLYSGYIIKNPGNPEEWEQNPNDFGLAYHENGKTFKNVLDSDKLNYSNHTACSALKPNLFKGINLGFKVTSQYGTWQCTSPPRRDVLMKRLVYVHFSNKSYYPAVLEAWAT